MLSQFIQRKNTISWQGMCTLWMLIVLLIGKRYNCPLSKAKNIFWWNRFHALSSYWTGQIWGWNPTAHCRWIPPTVQEPFTFPLTLIPRKTQLPESHHLKYQRPGSKKTLQLHPRSAVQCVRLSVMLAWQVCVFVVVLMRPLWPVSSLQSGSSSYGACCSHMELALSGRVAGQERGLHLSAHSTAGVSLPARPPLWDGLQMHPTVLLHNQV